MKWAILLYGLGISGGANVIFEHALYAYNKGVQITFVSKEKKCSDEAAWHKGTEKFIYKTIDEAEKENYDVVIATEWRSAFDACSLKARKYIYFVQSIESRFYQDQKSLLAYVANNSYEIDFNYITEASWIQKYLKRYYNKNAVLVHNGMNKDVFNANGRSLESRNKSECRILVEGSVNNWLKNVPRTIELCQSAGANEIWLVTPDEIKDYPGVNRVFSQVPFDRMPEIYRSCDILVKLSLVEGMFGPPLEMFHCGGTALTYNIEGAEEYLIDGYNSIVVEKGDEEKVITSLKEIIHNTVEMNTLKENAMKTAYNWIDWNDSCEKFWKAIMQFPNMSKEQIENIKNKGEAGAYAYRLIENTFGSEANRKRIEEAVEILKKSDKQVYIYGAGYFCRNSIWQFDGLGQVIDGIIVSDTNTNPKAILGHQVYAIDEMVAEKDNIYIFISSDKYRDEIISIIKDKGFKYYV